MCSTFEAIMCCTYNIWQPWLPSWIKSSTVKQSNFDLAAELVTIIGFYSTLEALDVKSRSSWLQTIHETLVHQSRSQHCMHYCITSTCRQLTFSSLLLLIQPLSSASSTLQTQALSPQLGLHRHHQPPVHQGRIPLWQRCYLQLLDWIVYVQGALHTIHGYIQYWFTFMLSQQTAQYECLV